MDIGQQCSGSHLLWGRGSASHDRDDIEVADGNDIICTVDGPRRRRRELVGHCELGVDRRELCDCSWKRDLGKLRHQAGREHFVVHDMDIGQLIERQGRCRSDEASWDCCYDWSSGC